MNLPGHVLGHPCLYYPNFISNAVASQVTQHSIAPASANTPLKHYRTFVMFPHTPPSWLP